MECVEAENRGYQNSASAKIWKTITSFREANLMIGIIIVGFILTMLSSHFLTRDNLISTAIGLTSDGIIAVGMTVALVSGGLDLSVGSVMGLSGVVAGTLYLAGINIWVACTVALMAGMFCGLINGFFIGKIGLNPFITTLGISGVARGTAYVLTQGSPISLFGVPHTFALIGQGKILGIPFIVFVFIVIAVIGDFMMRRSEPLRKVFYTGSNEKAAVLSGINTSRVKVGVYLLTATLASIAGILSMARFTVAAPTAGIGAEMRSISAAIIGGASISGGEGTIFGAVLGVILLNFINNGLIILNVPVYWQELANGVFLIAAVTFDYLSHRNKLKNLKNKK
ncbi:ABC transporter permease [Petroclostridium xylanilyticum]|uniref:ABC transporter permease n=1 Tax=Petroclostridium xylanilyticum TaxID=1792311 RepID=UPI000B983E08|nr:ABC transporter permease [Petroclostridium xylanilyticum]